MQITFYSFLLSILWSNILIIFIFLGRKKHFFDKGFGIASLVLLYLFCTVRMLFPIDFKFTRGIGFKGFFTAFYDIIYFQKFNLGVISVSILEILGIVWMVVTFILIIRFWHQYYCVIKEIDTYNKREDNQCQTLLHKIWNNNKRQLQVEIFCSNRVGIPMGIGIFKKRIILPDEDYTDMELYYILLHEYTHFLNRDLIIKMLVHMFCYIFWWNPIVYLLRKDLEQTLEIKCDLYATEDMSNRSKADYLTTIVSSLKRIEEKKLPEALHGTVALAKGSNDLEMVERFRMISKTHTLRRHNKVFTTAWFGIFAIMLVFSYSFVIQPSYSPPIEEIVTNPKVYDIEITPDNSYIIERKDGTYVLVNSNGETLEITEKYALLMESQGMKIRKEVSIR